MFIFESGSYIDSEHITNKENIILCKIMGGYFFNSLKTQKVIPNCWKLILESDSKNKRDCFAIKISYRFVKSSGKVILGFIPKELSSLINPNDWDCYVHPTDWDNTGGKGSNIVLFHKTRSTEEDRNSLMKEKEIL